MATDPSPRLVAGLWCGQVLALLPDLVDGTLSDTDRARVEGHVADCRWCADFGGRYGAVVDALHARLSTPAPVPDDVADRLDRALDAALDAAGPPEQR